MTIKENDIFTTWNSGYSSLKQEEAQKLLENTFGSTAQDWEIEKVLDMAYSARGMKLMFIEVNRDCLLTGETFARFDNTVYYSLQLQNIYGFTESESKDYAEMMSVIAVEEKYIFPEGFEYLSIPQYREGRAND